MMPELFSYRFTAVMGCLFESPNAMGMTYYMTYLHPLPSMGTNHPYFPLHNA